MSRLIGGVMANAMTLLNMVAGTALELLRTPNCRFPRLDFVLLAILTIPAAIALINPTVPFGNIACDSWAWFSLYTFNYERFWDFPTGLTRIGPPLPGMFPGLPYLPFVFPVVATYLLYFLLFWTTLVAWYVAARQFAERWGALLATTALCLHSFHDHGDFEQLHRRRAGLLSGDLLRRCHSSISAPAPNGHYGRRWW